MAAILTENPARDNLNTRIQELMDTALGNEELARTGEPDPAAVRDAEPWHMVEETSYLDGTDLADAVMVIRALYLGRAVERGRKMRAGIRMTENDASDALTAKRFIEDTAPIAHAI
ncbi:hypothetical protein [Streptomyces sp. TR02-1]|uniref:hypothetical protein n=1 Tax=Streptomyces sp. TR02-1 TaxID=3385977 RepID=UPI0039A01FCF